MTTAAVSSKPNTVAADTRRITESDADYRRLYANTVVGLTASVRLLIADLKRGMAAQDAANTFSRRHTAIIKQAYLYAHAAGARDYYDQVSRTPAKWANRVQPNERVMVQRILFYAAGSVLKMANEAVQAWHDTQTAHGQAKFAELATPIQDYFTGLSGRLNLQGEIAWSGLNDGYTDAGGVDPASPYAVLYWDLGPVKTQHCGDCPRYAAASPYDRPGSGGNELDATPGDGHTECGAACHCSLRYGMAPTAEQAESVWQQAKGAPPTPPGSLKWPNAPRPTQEELDAHQQKLLDDYRAQFDHWEAVRGDLPALPDLFGTQGAAGGWVTWDQLTPAQQTVLSDVFGVLAQVDAAFGHPSLEEATAAFGAAQEDLAQFLQQLQVRTEHLDQFLADLQTATEQDWIEWFGKGPIASLFWSLKQDWYDTLEWFISRTEPPNAQMAERYTFTGGHQPGYTQNRDKGGRWAPGEGRGESGGGGGGVHAPHGMAAAHGQHAHGGQGGAGGHLTDEELRQHVANAEERIRQQHQRIGEADQRGVRTLVARQDAQRHYDAQVAAHNGDTLHPDVWAAHTRLMQAARDNVDAMNDQINLQMELRRHVAELGHLRSLAAGRNMVQYEDTAARDSVHAVFGRDVPDHEMMALFGAKAGDVLELSSSGPASFHVDVMGQHMRGSHTVWRDALGIGVHTGLVRTDEGARTPGSGREIVRSLVRMRDMGIGRIEASAARGARFNGYDTWAKLGFTGDIPSHVLSFAQARFGSQITRVEQLMRQPGGARWWRENGDTWDATFDFTPGTYSRAKLDAFAARLGREEPLV